jgi:hypothetical protein
LFVTGIVGAVGAACSSSSGSGGGGGAEDGGQDAAADATTTVCGNIGACYQVAVTVDPGSPAACGSGTTTAVSDYSSIRGDGQFVTPDGSCQGKLAGCVMTLMCTTATGAASWQLSFTDTGFTGAITQAPCSATVVGTRLATCPPPAQATEGGVDASSPSEASAGGDASPAMDASPDGPAHDAGPADASAPDADAATQVEGGADAGTTEAGPDGGAPEAAVDAGPDAADDGGAQEAAADSSVDDGSGGDGAPEGGPDAGDASDAPAG